MESLISFICFEVKKYSVIYKPYTVRIKLESTTKIK